MATRPKHLNLLQIRLPMPGLVSILHRVSGAALFFALPLLLYWLQQSLAAADTWEATRAWFRNGFVKLIVLGLVWAYFHHLLAGIRHLAMDVDFALDLPSARLTSALVLFGGILLTVIAGVLLW